MTRSPLILLAVCSLPICAASDDGSRSKAIVFNHVTVIDVSGAGAQADRIVVITGDRISEVGQAGQVTIPNDAQVVDAAGKFLIPGLWDMHVHIVGRSYLPLFLANGVTGVRDMHAFYPESIFQMRQEVKGGKLFGPRIVAAGAIIDGDKPYWPGSVAATNPEEGRTAVQTLKKRGADFIKVYSKLTRETYLAIADEAKKQDLMFVGHVPESVCVLDASDAGQKSFEHLYGVFLGCSTEEATLRKDEVDGLARLDNAGFRGMMIRTQTKALDTFSEEKAQTLFARLAKNGTWQVPTLSVLRAIASLDDEKFTNDPRIKYMPAYVRSMWKPNVPAETIANLKRVYQKSIGIVTAMRRAGVPLLAGTDTTNPYCFPGFSLHDELALLVEECKLTPLEALQCATSSPAKFLGKEREFGTIEKGKLADLVLLDADPLINIKNAQRIAAVVVNGTLLTKADLQKMLAEVEATVGGK